MEKRGAKQSSFKVQFSIRLKKKNIIFALTVHKLLQVLYGDRKANERKDINEIEKNEREI